MSIFHQTYSSLHSRVKSIAGNQWPRDEIVMQQSYDNCRPRCRVKATEMEGTTWHSATSSVRQESGWLWAKIEGEIDEVVLAVKRGRFKPQNTGSGSSDGGWRNGCVDNGGGIIINIPGPLAGYCGQLNTLESRYNTAQPLHSSHHKYHILVRYGASSMTVSSKYPLVRPLSRSCHVAFCPEKSNPPVTKNWWVANPPISLGS